MPYSPGGLSHDSLNHDEWGFEKRETETVKGFTLPIPITGSNELSWHFLSSASLPGAEGESY